MNKILKKSLVGFFAVAVMFSFSIPSTTSAVTIEELQAQIAQLIALIAQLQSGGTTGGTVACYAYTKNLTLGSKGDDVKALQQYLNANGFAVAATGAGSPGSETTYFGNLTKTALASFQAAKGINPPAGYFGPITRNWIATNCVPGTGGVIPTTSYLKVEMMGPVAGAIPSGSIYNEVLKVKLMAGKDAVTINGITFTRGGYIANTNVSGVSVWDEAGNRYGNIITSLTSDGKATFSFGTKPITIAAGQTMYIYVKVNIASGVTSGTINFSITAATDITATTGVPIEGTFPVTGNVMSIVDGSTSLGDVRVDDRPSIGISSTTAQTSSYAGNVEVGYTDREIYKFSITQNNSKEAVKLEKITFYVGGTINENSDLMNFKLYAQDGTVIATADRAYDRYVTFILSTPFVIDKGLMKEFTVKVDIMDGSGSYFYMGLQDDYDVVVRGATTGAGILAVDSAGASLTMTDVRNDSTGWDKIKEGIVTLSKATSSPSGNIAPGSQNVVLAVYNIKGAGEALEIRKLGVQVKYVTTALTGTLTVRDADTSETYLSISADTTGIATTTTPDATSLLTYQQNLSSNINLAAGQTKRIEVLGTIPQTATSTTNYTVYTGQVYAKLLSSNKYENLAASAVSANNLTVKEVSVSVNKDTSMPDSTRTRGASNVLVGRVVLTASGDNVRINSISIDIATSSNFQNVMLKDGETQIGNTIGTPTATGNSFSLSNYILEKDAPKVISVYADVLSNAATTSIVSVSASGISGSGVNSSVSLSSTPATATALQTITLGTPSVTIAADDDQPTSKILFAGQNNVEIHKIKFTATNEDLTLKKITLLIQTASTTVWTATSSTANFGTVYLYDGTNLKGSGMFNSSNGTVAITLSEAITLTQNTDKILTVKVNVNGQAGIVPKTVSALRLYSSSTADLEINSSAGLMDTGVTVTDNALSNYHLYTVSAPIIATVTSGSTPGTKGPNAEIGRFTISNPGTRPISLSSTTFSVTLTANGATSTVNGFKLYSSTDESTPIDTDNTQLSASSTPSSATVDITFDGFSPTQTIAAGATKTYILKASTTGITYLSGSIPSLQVSVLGAKGYSSTDDTSSPEGEELYWNDGVVLYSYSTTASGNPTYSNLLGTDTFNIYGITYTY